MASLSKTTKSKRRIKWDKQNKRRLAATKKKLTKLKEQGAIL